LKRPARSMVSGRARPSAASIASTASLTRPGSTSPRKASVRCRFVSWVKPPRPAHSSRRRSLAASSAESVSGEKFTAMKSRMSVHLVMPVPGEGDVGKYVVRRGEVVVRAAGLGQPLVLALAGGELEAQVAPQLLHARHGDVL